MRTHEVDCVIAMNSFFCRWVFWVDKRTETIERIGVNGMGREIIKSNIGTCVEAMTMDFPSFTIFYLDDCTLNLKSVRMDGVRTSSSLFLPLTSLISTGISVYEDFIYWADSSTFSVRRVNRTIPRPQVVDVNYRVRSLLGGVEVVHPVKQPFGKNSLVRASLPPIA